MAVHQKQRMITAITTHIPHLDMAISGSEFFMTE
jgi:hypothetical protein